MNSEGGISYATAYHMPIAYRRINIKKIADIIERYNEEREKASSKGSTLNMKDLTKRREEMPDYVSPRAMGKKQ